MKTVKINRQRTIVLPKSVFKPADEVVTFCKGYTFIVRKINPSDVTEIASRVKEKAPPIREIVKEVHCYRKHKRVSR